MQTIETTQGWVITLADLNQNLEIRRSQGIPTRFVIDCPTNGDIAGEEGGYVEAFSIAEAWDKRAAESIGGGITAARLQEDGYRIRVYWPDHF